MASPPQQPVHDQELMMLAENSEEICNSAKSVSYSVDNRCAICCNEVLLILRLLPNFSVSEATTENNCLFRVRGQKTMNLKLLPPFSLPENMIDMFASIESLSDEQKHQFVTDTTLYKETFLSGHGNDGFRHALFSPLCPGVDKSFLGSVTLDGRVFIFEELNEVWQLAVELTPLIKQHVTSKVKIPVTIGKDMSFSNYKDLMQSITSTEFTWSSIFESHDTPSGSSLLLFCGTLNGHVTVWKIRLPLQNSDDIIYIDTDKYKNSSEVTALAWNSKDADSGYLSIGYMDGSVRCLSVKTQIMENPQTFSLEEIFAADFCDDMMISDMNWLTVDADTDILLVGKQTFLSVFSLEQGSMCDVENIKLDITWPIGSICSTKHFGCISCEDDTLFYFQAVKNSDKVSIKLTKKKKMTCLPQAAGRVWFCHGAALSPAGALCISIHKPIDNIVKTYRKTRVLDRQRVVLNVPDLFPMEQVLFELPSAGKNNSSQDLMLRMAINIQNAVKTGEGTEDVLRQLKTCIDSDETCFLQIARSVLLHRRVLTCLSKLEANKDDPVLMMEATEKILRHHVLSCLQRVSAILPGTDSFPLPSMLKWIKSTDERFNFFNEHVDVDELSSLFPYESLSCVICAGQLEYDGILDAICYRGHRMRLCCLSLSPCGGFTMRNCEACNAAALSQEGLSAIQILSQKTRCTLCRGNLVQKTT